MKTFGFITALKTLGNRGLLNIEENVVHINIRVGWVCFCLKVSIVQLLRSSRQM